jgi:RNA polymerase sigma-70 factor (ECF subfamily)
MEAGFFPETAKYILPCIQRVPEGVVLKEMMTVAPCLEGFGDAARKGFFAKTEDACMTFGMDRIDSFSSPPEDAALLGRMARGDEEALSLLYDRYAGALYGLGLRILQDAKEAEDVVQEVFVLAWKAAESYESRKGTPFGWLVILTRNRAIDHLRRRQRRSRTADVYERETPEADWVPPGEQLEDGERTRAIRRALQALPEEQRQAIELAFFGALSQAEIAEKLATPLGTVKARIRRGLLKLQELLEGAR